MIRRRPPGRGRSLFLAFLFGIAPALWAAQDPSCAPDSSPRRATIKYVIDGDTVILADGEHVRMVGIDTPEIGHDGEPDQPGGVIARNRLQSRLAPGSEVLLAGDRENLDRHGRLLRHLFLSDGTNLQAELLADGLATPLVIRPNLGYQSCYQQAVKTALAARRGLWQRPEYQPVDPRILAPETRGFRIVRDRVAQVHWTRGGAWLELDGPLSVTIAAADFSAFDPNVIQQLPGQRVEVRGMVYPRGRGLRMYLRHPLDLILSPDAGTPAPQ